ncbi:MAG: hypothetical protein IPN04_02835 [Rhodoferax sp.]|nr:hypothetical protein [Rhodoferax sp.]
MSNPARNPAQTVSFTDTLPAGLRVARRLTSPTPVPAARSRRWH